MASLGSIDFAHRDADHDSASAFLLQSRPRDRVSLRSENAIAEAVPDSDYVVVRFSGATDADSARSLGLEHVQQCLDLLSILGSADLITKKPHEESVVSWRDERGQVAQIRSTTTLSFTVPPANATVRDQDGNEVRHEPTPPRYHRAFRYYRLSQASDDLYESFRNMYLCFEMLLSARTPIRRGERERDWLSRSLEAATAELELPSLLKCAARKVPDKLLSDVYTAARLPLFHAKADRTVLTPQGTAAERQIVTSALYMLTPVVLKMAETWWNARRVGGGVFTGWVFRNLRTQLSRARVLIMRDPEPFDPNQRDLSHERYTSAVTMSTCVCDDREDPRIPVLLAHGRVDELPSQVVVTIEVVDDESPILWHSLPSPLVTDGLDVLEYRDRPAIVNVNQPRRRFAT